MSWIFILAGVGLLAVGFVVGLVTFKRSLQWCRGCGATLICPLCDTHGGLARVGRPRVSAGATG